VLREWADDKCKLLEFYKVRKWEPWMVGWQEGHPACKKTEWWYAGMVVCLGQGADLHMAQLMPLPLTISSFTKSRFVLPSCSYLYGAGSPG